MAQQSEPRRPVFGRQILIEKRFQLKFAVAIAASGLVVAVFCGTLFYLFLRGAHANLPLPDAAKAQLARQDTLLLAGFVAIMALFVMASGYLGLLASHRLAGPEYVMTRYLTELADGKYPATRSLRKNDQLQGLFELLQTVIELQRAREVEEAYKIEQALESICAALKNGECRGAISSLKAIAERKRLATSRQK